ncbi:MAG: PEP-CTERM sorting domain-containing protein [Puniceicoccales bacterium]|jgi:hypothetical protein|nr:PEP-CTERM sorting domain-containing protein [Puniceicoccales bacterium]
MKTTPRTTPLKTLSLAAAAGLTLGIGNTPELKATHLAVEVQAVHNVNATEVYDSVHVSTSGILNVYGKLVVAGSLSLNQGGTLEVYGEMEALDKTNVTASDLHVSNGIFKASNGVFIDHNAILSLTCGELLIGSYVFGNVGSTLNVGSNSALFIDESLVKADDVYVYDSTLSVSGGGQLEARNTMVVGTSNSVVVDLNPAISWVIPFVVPEGSFYLDSPLSIYNLPFSYEFAAGTEFIIAEARDGVYGSGLTATTILSDVTGQQFDLSVNGSQLVLTAQAIPEPSTYALIGGVGAVALAVLARRRRRG